MVVAFFWPLTHLWNIYFFDPDAPREASSKGGAWAELFVRYLRQSTYIFMALIAYCVLPYPIERAAHWSLDWVLFVIVRNLVMVGSLYELWHWVLYESTLKNKLRPLKFNPKNLREDGSLDPSKGYNPPNCRFWACSGILIESLYECMMLHLWATGAVPYYTDFWSMPLWSLLWCVCVPYWRDGHFYFVHRMMHPYFKERNRFDPGRFLYNCAHSLHHKSYNTGPWSGLSMHPIEHVFYLSCVFFPSCFLIQHPFHFLFNHFHVLVSPLPGHDGYDQPAGGSWFHYLHHAHFEVNYGTPLVPFDKLFGSFDDGSRYGYGKLVEKKSEKPEKQS
eukprot:gnl/MRDRNA2_/MRDRNA2_33760_c0_seq1.p1 gnl/MRDRNA2_/MRDRNA2_33760_c0~~gnl/MRDRNA2_/MRDRNA2_33760_c0_seq1.p1  ORF type:complete len:333 (-),score=26.66 gnl/MRDRNA2_/MRDRNA2_33760_c0_seq1:146-1144(-)